MPQYIHNEYSTINTQATYLGLRSPWCRPQMSVLLFPKSLWSGHPCGPDFSFDGRSFRDLGLRPLLRSSYVLLTHSNCLQDNHRVMVVMSLCQLQGPDKHGEVTSGACWLVTNAPLAWKLGCPHWPLFLSQAGKHWKYGEILPRLLHCTIQRL